MLTRNSCSDSETSVLSSSCFLAWPTNLYAFFIPITVILLVNLTILIKVTAAIHHHFQRNKHLCRIEKVKKHHLRELRMVVGLSFLLGSTWLVGWAMVYSGKHTTWIQYIFVLLTSSQGVVVFVFQCLLRQAVCKAVGKTASKARGRLGRFLGTFCSSANTTAVFCPRVTSSPTKTSKTSTLAEHKHVHIDATTESVQATSFSCTIKQVNSIQHSSADSTIPSTA